MTNGDDYDNDVQCMRHGLVICDLQTVALNSLPETPRRALVDFIRLVLRVIESQPTKYKIVWSGLCFASDYNELPDGHKVFGALKRLYRMTKGTSRFFVKGDPQTQFVLNPHIEGTDNGGDSILWRSSLMPPSPSDWHACLGDGITNVTVVGVRTAYSVQATVQALCDLGYKVTVIEECILDDDMTRHKAILEQLLPLYADIVRLSEWIELHAANLGGTKSTLIQNMELDPTLRYLCDCGRGGHSFLYQQHLTMFRTGWARYPLQPWFTDTLFSGRSYQCPLGRRIIDFCDEPQFSRCCMYVKGREWLDEKEKLWQLVPDLMPTTYVAKNRRWVEGDSPPGPTTSNDVHEKGPYFVKDCMKNGGKAVKVVSSLESALELAVGDSTYVVQRHVSDPWLTTNGQKCHIKSYFLLVEDNHGQWQLRMFPEAFLSVSPNEWSDTDLRSETQITVKRTTRLYKNQDCPQWDGWPSSYALVRNLVCEAVKRAVDQGKLKSRSKGATPNLDSTSPSPTARQFEIFSADVMVDKSRTPWLIECNFGCVLFDPKIGQPLTTIGLKTYQSLYEMDGEKVQVNDHRMIADTVSLVFEGTPEEGLKWELVGSFEQPGCSE